MELVGISKMPTDQLKTAVVAALEILQDEAKTVDVVTAKAFIL